VTAEVDQGGNVVDLVRLVIRVSWTKSNKSDTRTIPLSRLWHFIVNTESNTELVSNKTVWNEHIFVVSIISLNLKLDVDYAKTQYL